MKLLRRRRRDLGEIRADNIMWGVPRREGYSDTDDPLVHEGLVQHAFLMGQDDQALCGARPPRRLSRADRTPRAQLALAGPANPRCQKCEAVLAAGTITSPSTFVTQARPERSTATRPDEPGQAAAAASAVTDASDQQPATSEAADGEPTEEKAADESTDSAQPEKAADKPDDDGDDGDDGGPADSASGRQSTDEETPGEQSTDQEAPSDSASADAGEPADSATDAEPGGEQQTEAPADLLVASHPSARVRRGGLITIPAGRQSVLAELPTSAHDAAIAAEIDGGAAQVRVQAVALNDDGTLRITLNQPTTESIDVMWFVV